MQQVVAHGFNPRMGEAEPGGSVRPNLVSIASFSPVTVILLSQNIKKRNKELFSQGGILGIEPRISQAY